MKYRKKPLVIEARQLTPETMTQITLWAHNGLDPRTDAIIIPDYGGVSVRTSEGRINAYWGDYIIKGIQGEFYPCKEMIFEATYEPA